MREQALENARNMENLKKIQAMLTQGIPFAKHNRKVRVRAARGFSEWVGCFHQRVGAAPSVRLTTVVSSDLV